MPTPCARLAPSPTGALHLGNARSFLLAWLSARSKAGRVILRIEDLDHPKVKKHTVAEAIEDLRWLGLDWDEGPDIGGQNAPYVQSQRTHLYAEALKKLVEKQLVYPCTCSRRDVEAAQSAPHREDYGPAYPGTCRGKYASYEQALSTLPNGRLPAWRFIVPDREIAITDAFMGEICQNPAKNGGDFVLARHPHGAGYQLAVVVDDHAMGITEVLRGDDLAPCAVWQKLLYDALCLPCPEFAHVPLVCGPDGKRLAKRHGDTRVSLARHNGTPPERVVGLLAYWSGMAEFGEEISAVELLKLFSMEKVPHSPIILSDAEKQLIGL